MAVGKAAIQYTIYPFINNQILQFYPSYKERKGHTAILRKVVRKKLTKMHATRPKGGLDIHWNFTYWSRGNEQVCIFICEEFVIPLSVELLLLLSQVFEQENSSKI